MATLVDLWTSLFPAARPVVPLNEAARSRTVGWVRVLRARVPAFDGLDAGDLAIVPAGPLSAVAAGLTGVDGLIAELVRVRVAALLLIEGEPSTPAPTEHVLETLAAAAAAVALPTLRHGRVDTAMLERSVIGFLVNRRAELDRQAALLEAQLEALALANGELAALVGAIGSWLGRAVVLEGRRGDALAIHAPADVPDAALAVQRYLARPRSVALRVALPAAPVGAAGAALASAPGAVGGSASASGLVPGSTPVPSARTLTGRSVGSLALLGDRPVSELERVVTERIAAILALELVRDESVRRARDTTRRGEALPAAGPPWVVLLADQTPPGEATSLEQREELRRELRLLAPARRLVLRGDAASLELRAVLAGSPDDPAALTLAGRIATFLARTVALSRPISDPADRPVAEAESRATLEAVRPLANPPQVAEANLLAAYRLLGGLHNVPDGIRQARTLLGPLLVGRPADRSERLATLRALLDHPGPGDAAVALGVHRNTVAYRTHRIEALTGWRLADPDLRLALGIALRIMQSAQD